jgi:mRNA-degrading endonuclease RelE of RelBE toxin-antitoxin system
VARYSLRIKKSARKELESIATRAKLSGLERYRIRQGRYRILYTIEDSVLVVHVIKVGDRKNVYQSKK